MKRLPLKLPLLISLILIAVYPAVSAVSGVIQESVTDLAVKVSPDSYIDVLLSFEDDLDIIAHKAYRFDNQLSRRDNYHFVYDRLTNNRKMLEGRLGPTLDEMRAQGQIESFRFFTISSTILVRTKIGHLEKLAELPGVSLINLNNEISLIKPVDVIDPPTFARTGTISTALETVNIRTLWNRGLNGKGTLICSFDTGVDGDHTALGSKWRGNNGASSSASWFAPHKGALPEDDLGHGTHVMGIMVAGTDTDTIGVAYAAQWITAAVIDQGADFNTTIADILDAFDWALNPDGDPNTFDDVPDVICNSWGVPKGVFGDCGNTFWTAIDNVEAAGIVAVFAAGNEGPNSGTIRNPADRASSPVNTFTVGAIDAATNTIADFSSRGPSSCGGVIKPEVVAPGVSIYSTFKNDSYKIMSGTSMAAPFIAGLVALVRQYNPEATVDEIKYALMASTNDLGPLGEDNSYGHGLVDASKLLDYISDPSRPPIRVYSHSISAGNDGYADPGELAEILLTLNDPTGTTDSVAVWLKSTSDQISTYPDTVKFHFAPGSHYALSLTPFHIQISPEAISASLEDLKVYIQYPEGLTFDSTTFQITIGRPLPGNIFAVNSGSLSLTVSDFGQFGFGAGSIYQAGGNGFTFDDSPNLLYEGGLLIGRSENQVSDAIRLADATYKNPDFAPDPAIVASGTTEILDLGYSDDKAITPIPVEIRQTIHHTDEDFLIMELDLKNPTPDRVDPLSAGLFFDFDIDCSNDQVGFDSMLEMIYQYSSGSGIYIGMIGLSNDPFAFKAGLNDPGAKTGFDRAEKYQLISCHGINIEDASQADWYFVLSHTTLRLEGFDHKKIAVALLTAYSLDDLRNTAISAMAKYNLILDAEEERLAIPDKVELYQNYPNPFNPITTISFALNARQQVILAVYNITGQEVRLLLNGSIPAGKHDILWDGTNDYGQAVSSGIYFYRLMTESSAAARKMMLIK